MNHIEGGRKQEILPPMHHNIEIAPQKGRQEDFVSTCADIALYGGAAGGG